MSISLSAVTRRFGAARAVDGLTAEVPKGCFFSVLGPSGCGKSTLLRMIAGLEPLDSGTIALQGRTVAAPGLHVPPEARGVGVVFQSYALWPHMDVLDNVAFPLEASGLPRATARGQARSHLDSVALTGFADRRPADLSGGQRQRVALARCLAAKARIVLMDEPLANLDPHLRAAMEEEMSAFHARANATTLFITHDQREAMALSDLVAVMRAGQFEQIATPQDLHDRPANAFVAGFVGEGCIVPVQVLAVAGTTAHLRLPDGSVIEASTAATARPGAGQVLLRPSHLHPDPAGKPARVRAAVFRGQWWDVRVDMPGLPVPIRLSLPRRVTVGEIVPVLMTGGWLLPE